MINHGPLYYRLTRSIVYFTICSSTSRTAIDDGMTNRQATYLLVVSIPLTCLQCTRSHLKQEVEWALKLSHRILNRVRVTAILVDWWVRDFHNYVSVSSIVYCMSTLPRLFGLKWSESGRNDGFWVTSRHIKLTFCFMLVVKFRYVVKSHYHRHSQSPRRRLDKTNGFWFSQHD